MQKIYKFILIHFVLLLTLSVGLNAQNLINNPGFESGIAGWSKNMNNGASVNFTTDTLNSPEGNKHLKAAVSKLGKNDWDVQKRYNGFAVDQIHKYRLTFKAKSASSGAEAKLYIQKNLWMGKSFTLTDSWKTYTYEFFPNEAVEELKFNFVKVAEYYIDDILLEDVTHG